MCCAAITGKCTAGRWAGPQLLHGEGCWGCVLLARANLVMFPQTMMEGWSIAEDHPLHACHSMMMTH